METNVASSSHWRSTMRCQVVKPASYKYTLETSIRKTMNAPVFHNTWWPFVGASQPLHDAAKSMLSILGEGQKVVSQLCQGSEPAEQDMDMTPACVTALGV